MKTVFSVTYSEIHVMFLTGEQRKDNLGLDANIYNEMMAFERTSVNSKTDWYLDTRGGVCKPGLASIERLTADNKSDIFTSLFNK